MTADSRPPRIMGILNVTPDSFSDGGRHNAPAAAIEHGMRLVAEGAHIIDVGGESTRPGAHPVDDEAELQRVIPVVAELCRHAVVSIDTRHESVARKAVEAGATIINDVSASLHEVAADLQVGWVAMHMLGAPRTMQANPHYDDVVSDVMGFLVTKAEAARRAGVPEVWIDPGIGFGKTTEHNLDLLRGVDRMVASGFPVVIGVSRKRFLGELLAESDGVGAVSTDDRLEGSVSLATWSLTKGVDIVRVHDVAETVAAAKMLLSGA